MALDKLPKTPKKIRRSPEQWQAIMSSFDASGLTQEAFCLRESIAVSTFCKWRQKMSHSESHTNTPEFYDLSTLGRLSTNSQLDIALELGNGITLRLTIPQ